MILYSLIDFLREKRKFYELLSDYDVINETVAFDNNNNLCIDAEFYTSISKYKFLSKILKRFVDKKMLHLVMNCNFDKNLNQIKFKTKPKFVDYFDCYGIFYCDDEYNVLSHDIILEFNEKYKIAKMFETKIRENILNQIEIDIKELKKLSKDENF